MKKLYLENNKLILKTPYDQNEIDALKNSFPNARWDKLNKHWTLPIATLKRAIRFANDWNITIDDQLLHITMPDHPIGETNITLNKDTIQITIPYDPVPVNQLKTIPGTKWNPTTKKWHAPTTSLPDIIKWANHHHIPIPEHIQQQHEIETKKQQHHHTLAHATTANINIPTLQLELYPYQKAGVAYAAEKQRTFIADEMGLGKSLQALATTEHTNQYPALIICPTSLTEDWKTKIQQALPHRTTQIIQGRKTPELTETDYTIIGYPNIHTQKQHLKNQKHQTLILDESHYCKNPDRTNRS